MSDIKHEVNGQAAQNLRLGEHEILLSFNDDIGAEAFYTWWLSLGKYEFVEWAKNDDVFNDAVTE